MTIAIENRPGVEAAEGIDVYCMKGEDLQHIATKEQVKVYKHTSKWLCQVIEIFRSKRTLLGRMVALWGVACGLAVVAQLLCVQVLAEELETRSAAMTMVEGSVQAERVFEIFMLVVLCVVLLLLKLQEREASVRETILSMFEWRPAPKRVTAKFEEFSLREFRAAKEHDAQQLACGDMEDAGLIGVAVDDLGCDVVLASDPVIASEVC